jgi:hypothetical protein
MIVELVARNEQGKKALMEMCKLKRQGALPLKLLLSRVRFNAEMLQEEPFKVGFSHGTFNKLPYSEVNKDLITSALRTVLTYLDAKEEDVEVVIDGK